jgi:integrase
MAGRRPLTRIEERRLLGVVRGLPARDRALVTAQWLTGFRIHEVLSLTVGSAFRGEAIVGKIGITPQHLKGGYGRTRWVPVLPELERALRSLLWFMRLQSELTPATPLFLSRQTAEDGQMRPITRRQALSIIKAAFAKAGIEDDGRLGSHSLRKTFARSVYEHSGNNLLILKAALCHADISTTQRYLEVDEGAVEAAIRRTDFTRRRRVLKLAAVPAPLTLAPAA